MSCDLKSGVHVAAATTFLATLLQCAALGCSTLNGPHLSNKHRKQCRFSCKKIYIYIILHGDPCVIHQTCMSAWKLVKMSRR